MLRLPTLDKDSRVNTLLGAGHFLSHYYQLCLPPLFVAWQHSFGVSFAELGLAMTVMSGAAALLQTPVGFLVDRYGARAFLICGALLMALSISAIGLASSFWQVIVLALLSGAGNSVFHPADYSILSGTISPERIGRSFSFHTFCGYVGFAAAPPVTAGLMLLIGWRSTLLLSGLVAVPVVLMIVLQGHLMVAKPQRELRPPPPRLAADRRLGMALLLSRPILCFFGFYMVAAMATAGIQSWLITVLHQVHGLPLAAAAAALTGYMIGNLGGVLAGGWIADRTRHLLAATVLLVGGGALLLLWVGIVTMAELPTMGVLLIAGVIIGSSRTPRDLMVKQAATQGEIGKVFGFVSAGLSLGSALMPVPYGMLIDAGRPDLVLIVVGLLLLASVGFVIGARFGFAREPVALAAE
ncbi:MAG TPA: MFS transporter [Stellaceae bacterium]|nr:MFS transporter [Stellaceae bacterium]